MREPRTFEEPPVGELTPVDPTDLSDRAIAIAALQAAQQTHGCLEVHIAETKLANIDATEKRLKMADDILGVRTMVANVAADVRELALGLGTKKPVPGETVPKASAPLSWRAVFKIATGVSGSLGLLILTYQAFRQAWPAIVDFAVRVGPVVDAYLMSLSPT